jgi:hypothetical protein
MRFIAFGPSHTVIFPSEGHSCAHRTSKLSPNHRWFQPGGHWAIINIAARSDDQERETLRCCDQLPKGPIHLASKDCPVCVFLSLVAAISTPAEPKAAALPTGRDTASLLQVHSRSTWVSRTYYRVRFQIQISTRLVCSRDPPCMWPCNHHSSHILAQIHRRAIERLDCDSPGADHVKGQPSSHHTSLSPPIRTGSRDIPSTCTQQ